MDNFETPLATTVDKAIDNDIGAIVESLIKHIASTVFFQPAYSLDGLGPLIAVSGSHEEFFNSAFGIWICGKFF